MLMIRGAFEVEKYRTAVELHSKYYYGALRHSNSIRNIENRNGKPLQILPECPECASHEPECTSNAFRMSPDVIQNTAESHIYRIHKEFHSAVIPAHSASSVTGFEIPSRMWREFWKFFISAGSAWFLLIPNKCDDGGINTCYILSSPLLIKTRLKW